MEVTVSYAISEIMELVKQSFGFIVPFVAFLGAINFIFNIILTAFIGVGGKAGRLK